MAKIKYTKNELKTQRDALSRFQRFLPTLELKRQQLQLVVRQADAAMKKKKAEEIAVLNDLKPWVRLFAEDIDLKKYLKFKEIKQHINNIASVEIPIFDDVVMERAAIDFFEAPVWLDSGLDTLEQLIRLRVEQSIFAEQYRLLSEELLITTQRVNLFEKVKIPESIENIRIIRIFLGDQDTAAVVRAKTAKNKSQAAK